MFTDDPATLGAPSSSGEPGPATLSCALFALVAGPFDAGRLRVLSFRGREAVSRPFRFDVCVDVDESDVPDLEREVLGQAAWMTLAVPGGELRNVRGLVAAVEAQAAFEQGRHAFHLRLVPRLWLLGRRRTSRIFQDMSVPEILGDVP